MFDDDWFTKGKGAQGFIARKKKEIEDRQFTAQALREQAQKDAQEAEKKRKDEENKNKNFVQHVGDAIGGTAKNVGNFVKDAAVDVKDTAVGAVTGVRDVIEGSIAANKRLAETEEYLKKQKVITDKLYAITGDKTDDETWNKPEVKKLQNDMNKLALENGYGLS